MMLPCVNFLSSPSIPPSGPVDTHLIASLGHLSHLLFINNKIFNISNYSHPWPHMVNSHKLYNKIKYNVFFNIKCYWNWGTWHTPPLSLTSSSMLFYSSSSESPWNRIGYVAHIWFFNFQVASFGLRCFHCTFTCPMVWFWSKISLLSRIQSGSMRKSLRVPPAHHSNL